MNRFKAIFLKLIPAGAGSSRLSIKIRRGQRGTALVEAMAAVAITASTGVATLSLISIVSATSNSVAAEATASWLASSQAEQIHVAAYVPTPGQYASILAPGEFAVSNSTSEVVAGVPGIQLVNITVTRAGDSIVSIDLVKVDR